MGNKVHVLMPTGSGKKKLIEAFEGSRTHQLALKGENGYAMPGADEVEKKKTVNRAAAKESTEELPTEKVVEEKPVIEEGIDTSSEVEQAPQAATTEKKPRKTKSK
jgi:hypothetical protein